MADVSVQPLVTVFKGVDYGLYQLAEHLAGIRASGEWRNYTYDADSGSEKAGKHPSSFRKYLEDLTNTGRMIGCGASTGKLMELITQYEWMSGLGFDLRTMALIGYEALKDLRQQPEAGRPLIENVLAEFQQTGRMYLPNNRPEGTPRFALRVSKGSREGYVRLRGFVITQDGVPYVNEFPERLLHYASKRLRAAVEDID